MALSSRDRNKRCPCGSGRKFKSCCWDFCRVFGSDPPRVFSDGAVRTIESFEDLQPFWDSIVDRLVLFRRPGWLGIAPILGVIAVRDAAFSLLRIPTDEMWNWNAEEALRYLIRRVQWETSADYEFREISRLEAARAELTIKWFGPLSHVRDNIETVRLGFGDVTIDSLRSTIEFFDRPDTGADVAMREYYRFIERDESNGSQVSPRFKENSRRLVEELRNPLEFMSSELAAWRAVELLLNTEDDEGWPTAPSDWLPDGFDLGCYRVGEYRRVWGVLKGAVTVHRLLMCRLIQEGAPPPFTTSILLLDKEVLIDQVARLTGAPEDHVREIVRDLMYSFGRGNLDPHDHPLLPLGSRSVATIPRLVGGWDWDGSLVRAMERLPWRRKARTIFGELRESLMQGWLESKVAHLGAVGRRNIAIGPKAARAGDIDLLLFRDKEEVALALSLKWLYEPSLVQEVASQSARLQDAALRHEQLIGEATRDLARLAKLYGFPSALSLRPAVVVQRGPILQRVRNPDVPIVTSVDFATLAAKSNSLAELAEALARSQRELPPVNVSARRFRWWLGGYWFVTPGYDLRAPAA